MTDRPQTNATNAPAEWEAYAWKLEQQRDEAVAAREVVEAKLEIARNALEFVGDWATLDAIDAVASSSTPEPDA